MELAQELVFLLLVLLHVPSWVEGTDPRSVSAQVQSGWRAGCKAETANSPDDNTGDGGGIWLRCALHAHTTESDGELAPDLLARHYERAGYDVLAVTDHWKRTDAHAERILVLPSVELNCVLPGARDGHVLGFGVRCEPPDLQALAAEYAISRALPTGSRSTAALPISLTRTGRV